MILTLLFCSLAIEEKELSELFVFSTFCECVHVQKGKQKGREKQVDQCSRKQGDCAVLKTLSSVLINAVKQLDFALAQAGFYLSKHNLPFNQSSCYIPPHGPLSFPP